jgi:Bifunctional DNA primase/polymerase, N-terminal/Family of unknown function (DUF5906)/Primase C terminal 1 (PriCT-1)
MLPEVSDLSLALAARAYAQAGYLVFPLVAQSKVPFGKGSPCYTQGFKGASRELEKIDEWWGAESQANVGFATGPQQGVVVLDIDEKEGKHGLAELLELERDLGPLPRGPLQQTPSGGQHRLFSYPAENVRIACSTGELAAGIDVRADGGYIVVAPSHIQDPNPALAGKYLWIRRGELPALPNAWIMALARKPRARKKPDSSRDFDPASPDRNVSLYHWGCLLVEQGLDEEEVKLRLTQANNSFLKGPLPTAEFHKVLESVHRNQKAAAKGAALGRLLHRYVWCIRPMRFYDIETGAFWDREQFNSMYLHEFKQKSPTSELLGGGVEQVADTIVAPDQPRVFEQRLAGMDSPQRYLNVYVPTGIAPVATDVTPWLQHIEYLFGAEVEDREHLLTWMAHLIQHPGVKMEQAVLLKGAAGIGKTYLGKVLRDLVGKQYTINLSPLALQNRFNSWMENALLVLVEEVSETSSRRLLETLKALITDHVVRIERKGCESFETSNRSNFMMFTNHEDAMDLLSDDRRIWVYSSKAVKQQAAYYLELMEWTRTHLGGILRYLLDRPLPAGFQHMHAPMNSSKRRMVWAARTPLESHLAEAWHTGQPPVRGPLIAVSDVWEWYRSHSFRDLPNLNRVSSLLRELGAHSLGRCLKAHASNGPNLFCRPGDASQYVQLTKSGLWESYCQQQATHSDEF